MKKLSTLGALLCLWLTADAQYSLIKQDISPTGSAPARFTSFNGKTYFIANDGTHGHELWWSDGHSYGMVADINPGPGDAFEPASNSGYNLCVWGNSLYFAARDTALNVQLWEYNGISAPVKRTKLKAPNPVSGHVVAVQNKLYFKVKSLSGPFAFLYEFDPQTHGYRSIIDTSPPLADEPLASVGGRLLYYGRHDMVLQLVEYDPATQEPRGLGIEPFGSLYVYKNTAFFLAHSGGYGRELYRYDGGLPRRVTDINAGTGYSFGAMPGELTERMAVYNNKLYFMAMSLQSLPFRNLFSYDPVTDVVTEVAQIKSSYSCFGMAVYGRRLYIATDSNASQQIGLFAYDGSKVRHFSQLGFNTYTIPNWLTESNGRLYFGDWDFNSPVTAFETYVFTDSLALDVPEVGNAASAFSIYPNPASSEARISFTLQASAEVTIQLADMQGRIVYTASKQCEAGSQHTMIPLQQLAAGLYMCKITNEEGELLGNGKLVKQ